MTFLNPAILFGLLAASVPILIHLLNLRKLKKVEFSAVFLLKELQREKIKRIKLKQWILLLIRVLIIISIVLAFARPALKRVAISGLGSAAKTSAVFIIDNSFSMGAVDAKGSYLNQTKEIVYAITNKLQPGDEATIILTDKPDEEENKLTTDLVSIRKKTEEIKISAISTPLNKALLKAGEVFSKSNNYNKELYILSDFQTGSLGDINNKSDFGELFSDKIRIYSFNFGNRKPNNIAVTNFKINSKIFEKQRPITTTATISNYSGKDVETGVVSLFLGNDRCAQKSFTLKDGESKEVEIEGLTSKTGFVKVSAKIEDDDINQDNTRSAVIYIPEKLNTKIFFENESDTKFVKAALLSASEANSTLKIETHPISNLNRSLIDDCDGLIIVGGERIVDYNLISDYLSTGKGIIWLPGEKSDLQGVIKLCKMLSLPEPLNFINLTAEDGKGKIAGKVDFAHPLFDGLFTDKQKKSFDYPEIFSYFNIKVGAKGKSLISFEDNGSLISDFNFEGKKILFFATPPILSKSDLPLKGIFAPLLYKGVFYIAGKGNEEQNYLAGDAIELNTSVYKTGVVKVVNPSKVAEAIHLPANSQSKFYNFTKSDEAGIYEFSEGDKIKDVVAVNVNPTESVTEYTTDDTFEKSLQNSNFKGKFFSISHESNYLEAINRTRFGAEFWKAFALLAFILAVVEMVISRTSKKEAEGIV